MKLKKIVSGRKTEMKILTNLYGEAVKKQAMKILGSEAQAEKCRNAVMLMLEESLEYLGEYGSSQANILQNKLPVRRYTPSDAHPASCISHSVCLPRTDTDPCL